VELGDRARRVLSGFGGKTILIGDIADGGRTLKRVFIQETDENGNNIRALGPGPAS